ncbi:MAG: hypothetical protein IT318_08285 [Anaerolineales bacterium]|nr:hypothetical protein [Anaerolineales bacterium]
MKKHMKARAERARLHGSHGFARPGLAMKPARAQEAISGVVIALEDSYAALRRRWPELPAVVITVFYDRHRSVRGYFWDGQWRSQADPFLPELHIDSTILSDPPEAILKTLVHEAAHALARARDIKDTSREGRYHNQRFAELAKEMGLVAEPDQKLGVRTPRLLPEWLAGAYGPLVQVIGAASRRLWQDDAGSTIWARGNGQNGHGGANGVPASKGRLMKAVCRCDPPRIIRAARNTLESAPIHCAACGGVFSMNLNTIKETHP